MNPILIFRKVFGLAQFSHVVIVRHGAGERGIFVERNGARFREVRDDDAVVESTHGAVFHLAHERRIVVGQFPEPIIGDAVETHLVHGQKRHKEHRGENARLYPEQKEIDHIAPLSVFEAYRHDEYGNADDETEQKGAKARFDFAAREDGDHARRKGDERRAVERDHVIGGKFVKLSMENIISAKMIFRNIASRIPKRRSAKSAKSPMGRA